MSNIIGKIFSLSNINVYNLPALVLSVFCFYSTVNTYLLYKRLKEEYTQVKKKHERSNCVVTYACGSMSGWPPKTDRIKYGIGQLHVLFEPIIYFIDVTEKSLDIAVMMITVEKYLEALITATQRGVVIRIISEYEKNSDVLNKLRKMGVSVTYYVPTEDKFPKLFHYKYMVRDFGTNNECVCMGSMNYTLTGATDNYENLVFTQMPSIVENFHDNFEYCSSEISQDNNSLYKKTLLSNRRLI